MCGIVFHLLIYFLHSLIPLKYQNKIFLCCFLYFLSCFYRFINTLIKRRDRIIFHFYFVCLYFIFFFSLSCSGNKCYQFNIIFCFVCVFKFILNLHLFSIHLQQQVYIFHLAFINSQLDKINVSVKCDSALILISVFFSFFFF